MKEHFNKIKYGELNWKIEDKYLYKEFSNSNESKEWGIRYYKNWAKDYKRVMVLSENVVKNGLLNEPVECYCGYSYRQINNYLRNDIDNEFNTYREMADILAIVLCSAPRIPIDLVVYRIVNNEFIKNLIKENRSKLPTPIQEKGFMSTSLLKDIVNEEEPYAAEDNLLKIYVDKESIGIYVNSVTSRSEEEMLLFPNGFLGLIAYPYYDNDIKKTIFECKLINFYD